VGCDAVLYNGNGLEGLFIMVRKKFLFKGGLSFQRGSVRSNARPTRIEAKKFYIQRNTRIPNNIKIV
jgi:hypothetical protein